MPRRTNQMQVERHTSSTTQVLSFPPLIPDRGNAPSNNLQSEESIHDLGSQGKALVLEDAGVNFAKSAVKLKQAIHEINKKSQQVTRGIQRERKRRSNFGGEAASKQAKRREAARMNTLEASLQMWTTRANECGQKNDRMREKINQLRINMTSLKRVFNERCDDLKTAKEDIGLVMIDADVVEKLRQAAKLKLKSVLENYDTIDSELSEDIDAANKYIDDANVLAMERIDEVLKKKISIKKDNRVVDEKDAYSTLNNGNKKNKSNKKSRTGSGTFLTSGNEDETDQGWKPPSSSRKDSASYIEVHTDEEYKQAFEMIGSSMGGLTDPQDIVKQFLFNESNLFDIFQDVERLHQKIKYEKDDLNNINSKYDKITKSQIDANAATKAKLDQMQSRIDRTRSQNMLQTKTLKKIKRTFKKITTRLSDMFSTLDCDDLDDPNGLSSMQGGKGAHRGSATMRQYLGATVTENNVIKYLGVIEAKTIDIFDKYIARLEWEGLDVAKFSQGMNGPPRPHGDIRGLMSIAPPKMNITSLRKNDVRNNEENLEKGIMKQHDVVSPKGRKEILKELMESEFNDKKGKRRVGLGGFSKLKKAAVKAAEADKVIGCSEK